MERPHLPWLCRVVLAAVIAIAAMPASAAEALLTPDWILSDDPLQPQAVITALLQQQKAAAP